MPPAGGLKVAVLDAFDQPLVVWEDANLAKRILAQHISHVVTDPPKRRFWQRKHQPLDPRPIEWAVQQALRELSLEVARL